MIACTSPAGTSSDTPFRIGLSATVAWRLVISSILLTGLHESLRRDLREQLFLLFAHARHQHDHVGACLSRARTKYFTEACVQRRITGRSRHTARESAAIILGLKPSISELF